MSSGSAMPDHTSEGVWIAYGWDMQPYVLGICPSELEALRIAVENTGHVAFVPWGLRLDDAIKQYTGRG